MSLVLITGCGGENSSSSQGPQNNSDKKRNTNISNDPKYLLRFREITGNFDKIIIDDESQCPGDTIIFIDENRNSYSQLLDSDCKFSINIKMNRRYRIQLMKNNKFVGLSYFKNNFNEEKNWFYFPTSSDGPFDLGKLNLVNEKIYSEINPLSYSDFDGDGINDFNDIDFNNEDLDIPNPNINPIDPPVQPPVNPPVDPYDGNPEPPIVDPYNPPEEPETFWPDNLPEPEPLPEDLPLFENQTSVKAPNPDENDHFGYYHDILTAQTVDIDGDFLAIGSPYEDGSSAGLNGDILDNNLSNSGAVYLYQKVNGIWNFHSYLKASNPQENALFGRSLSIRNRLLVVGARGESSSAQVINGDQNNKDAPESGAAYVFRYDGNNWIQEAYLKASNNDSRSNFGTSVAVYGDRIVVGADGEDGTGENGNEIFKVFSSGAAYVFKHDGNSWFQEAYLKAPSPDLGDFFGTSVAIHDDTIVVGARFEDSGALGVNGDPNDDENYSSGAAYIFTLNNNQWNLDAYLKPTHSQERQLFSLKVAVWENTVAVSAPNEVSDYFGINNDARDINRREDAEAIGAVYLYQKNNNQWEHTHYIKTPASSAAFGSGLDLRENKLIIGSPFASSRENAEIKGGIFVYHEDQNQQWRLSHEILGIDTEENDFFGGQVCIDNNQIIVSAFGDDDDNLDSGAVFILE